MDLLLLLLLSFSVSTASSLSSDGVALLSLLKHWTSVPSYISSSWDASHSTPCEWVGIDCDNADNVVSLNLSAYIILNDRISGQLGPEIGNLRHLHTVDLSHHDFYGVIPQGLGINSSLVSFDVSYNNFVGKIPPNLCHGKQLRLLYMAFNRFEGSIPSGVGSCSSLTRLNLKYTNLTGVLPSSLGNCSNLTEISLSMNKLTGVIPQELSNCTKMDSFDIGSNLLNGSIPSSLRSWRRLSTLILSDNRFTGGIPPFLSELEKLSELQLGGNLLGGVIPSSIGELQSTFYTLNLSNNALTGQIPIELRKLIRLEVLDISKNHLTGQIPLRLGELRNLWELNISRNILTGQIPSGLGKLIYLKKLNMSHNNLTGPIPSALEELIGLEVLDISKNYLTGTLKALDRMRFLTVLDVSYNNFTGVVSETMVCVNISGQLSILGNPYLYDDYHPSRGLTCAGNNNSKPYEINRPIGRKRVPIVISFLCGFSIIICFFILHALWRRWRLNHREGSSSLLYKVMEATEHFNDQYIVGRGAHGTVYKASLHPYGDFAVKRIVFAGHEGRRLTMVREIETIGKIRHRNLVNFIDFCFGQEYGLILYGYMENGSLHDVLHGINPPPTLEWSVRYKIALGTAYGLAYIHHNCDPPILHRDIKPSNILLDSEMEAHVADFGVAKFLDQSSTSTTPISVVGTTGYIAPENAYRAAESTEKSDVYSYGVVLLELITRKKALDPSFVDQTDLVRWVTSMWSNAEELDRIVDSGLVEELRDSNIMEQVSVILRVALICTNNDPSKRPTMRDVVNLLLDVKNILLDVKAPWAYL